MDGQAIQPGSILAGRYRIEDLVGESAGSSTWRAFDQILNRSVSIRALRSDDPRRDAFLDAARRSTAVTDPRFLPVLDAVPDEDGIAYVVREWTRGLPLSVILHEGPLPSHRAASVVSELCEAVVIAHEAGMPHRAINPSTVLVKETGAVRITGLGTEHALRAAAPAPDPDEAASPSHDEVAARAAAEQVDIRAIGRVLYACLVARWPGGRGYGLPPAPTEHGRLLRPRQVRAGVGRDLDTVCDRILGQPPRHHETPLTEPREIALALDQVDEDESILADESTASEPGVLVAAAGNAAPPNGQPPALLPTRPRPSPPRRQPTPLERSREMARNATEGHRKLIWLGIGLLVVMAATLAFVVGRQSADEAVSPPVNGDQGGAATGTDTAPMQTARVVAIDPLGDGEEHGEDARFATDNKAGTSWQTLWYETPELGNLKAGVGLVVDLGEEREVSDLEINYGAAPVSYEVWTAPAGTAQMPTDAPGDTDDWLRRGAETSTDGSAGFRLSSPVQTRYVLLWLTELPPESGGRYRGIVNEFTVKGPVP